MTEVIPKGWIKTTLGEIAVLSKERVLPANVPMLRYIGLEHIEPQTMKLISYGQARDVHSSSLRFSTGDVLYGKMRPYLNKVWVAEFDGICSAEFFVFLKRDGLSAEFLARRLNADDFVTFANERASGERPRVDYQKLSSFPIALPPLSEQHRIVAKLNNALSRMERAQTAARRARERLRRYRNVVLNAAVTGELSRQWREGRQEADEAGSDTGEALLQRLVEAHRIKWEGAELKRIRASGEIPKGDKWRLRYREPKAANTTDMPELTRGWTWASPEQLSSGDRHALAIGPFGSDLKVSDYRDFGVPLIFVRNIRSGIFLDKNTRFISNQKAEELKAHQAKGGDILVTKMGDPPGEARLYPENAPPAIITADCIRLQPSPLIETSKTFFVHSINSKLGRDQILRITKGVAQQKVSLSGFSSIALPLPPLAEQIEITREVERRLSAADQLTTTIDRQLERTQIARRSLLTKAFAGHFVPQDPNDEPASPLIETVRVQKAHGAPASKQQRQRPQLTKKKRNDSMQDKTELIESLRSAWERIGHKVDALSLFKEAQFSNTEVALFYETLRATPEIRAAFEKPAQSGKHGRRPTKSSAENEDVSRGRFRLIELWLEDFKNLKNYTVHFSSGQGLDVLLGWNGTGKSNLFEALVIVFRDLNEWCEKNRWPEHPICNFRLSYEINEYVVRIKWQSGHMSRPEITRRKIDGTEAAGSNSEHIRREQLLLPRFVFGYYSGPSNRLAEHFLPMKQAHYERLRDAPTDDTRTMAELLEQRKFFCAETHHAKYVLLAFSYKEDPNIAQFLKDRLRILGFESVLFVIRKPRWAKPGSSAENFWGARGIMRRVMERLRRYAVAPMVVTQTVRYGYQSTTEEHYYFFLPDLNSLYSFAAEYENARTFFLALESTDFSELIHDVMIQVRIQTSDSEQTAITFHQLSEGEQQLLMVLGLMRFTKSHQSLILLDEPDTHLNPHWSVEYLSDLRKVMSDISSHESSEQQTSQILMATHDPLVIVSLVKDQIHLLKRDLESLKCYCEQPSEDPRGLGFTGILTSEMFGFRSDLDPETMDLLDKQARLAGKDKLNDEEAKELESVTRQVENLGFKSASSDPYYRAFIKAVARRQEVRNLILKPPITKVDFDALQRETDKILSEIEKEEAKKR